MIYSHHLIEETRLQGYTHAVTGAAVTSFTVSIPTKYQTVNDFEGYLYVPVGANVLTFFRALINGSVTGTLGGLTGAYSAASTPQGYADNGNGMLLAISDNVATYEHAWANFRLRRIGSTWSCSSQMGAGSAAAIQRVASCESLMPSGSNLATLDIQSSVAGGLKVGSVVKIFALVPQAIY